LTLAKNAKLTGRGFSFLTKLPLKKLDLDLCLAITLFTHLKELPLRWLNLTMIDVPNTDFFDQVSYMRGLQYLNLTLTNTRDADLSALVALPMLETLILVWCTGVTDAAFDILNQSGSLSLLNVESTSVTSETILQQATRYKFETQLNDLFK
jgi:hypothetical protein